MRKRRTLPAKEEESAGKFVVCGLKEVLSPYTLPYTVNAALEACLEEGREKTLIATAPTQKREVCAARVLDSCE